MQFSGKPLFENITAKFSSGNRYGLIGANGCGKSTFMKILGGDLMPSSGSIFLDPSERLGKLRQDHFVFEQYSLIDTVIMGHNNLWVAKQERDRLYGLAKMSEEDSYKVAELEVTYSQMDGYTAEARVGELLQCVGIPAKKHYNLMSEIAPGFKLRVLLAQVLFSDPEILLLDEPTNNLDINTIRWLEQVLNERNSTMIIVSHDRHFLNTVCTHIADLDYGKLCIYTGNYNEYMTAAALARDHLISENAKKKAQINTLQSFVSRFSTNASKSKQATSRVRQISKIKLAELPVSSRKNPFIHFEQDRKLFRNALEIEDLSKVFDNVPIFSKLNLIVEVGEKVAVIGSNGIGKSTLLKVLVGDEHPDSGIVKWSEHSNIGYYAQDHEYEFNDTLTVFEWMSQWKKRGESEHIVRGVLGRLLFNSDDIKKQVKILSGGEKGRMLFGKLMMQHPNILVMDEPTNHLDMESIESLNAALEVYKGTLIFVSHERDFVSSLATRILEITSNKIIYFTGKYEEYLHSQGIK
ncbi:fused predicted transporter subunits of ABC superfamily [Serratia symbiotica str. 'Cinara cedri']|nr:fused predicted transporter subunits of ABC superfamily [Serratia symbiotica str. 'Cinara cedri']